jgi:hypothetical protein
MRYLNDRDKTITNVINTPLAFCGAVLVYLPNGGVKEIIKFKLYTMHGSVRLGNV